MVQLICRRQLAQAADKLNVQFAFCHVKLSYEIFNGKIIYAIFMQINIQNFPQNYIPEPTISENGIHILLRLKYPQKVPQHYLLVSGYF